ncbi:MAG: cytochrome P450 [Armatimonadetes bacterium]|nr:cytochrome P450 [Armatimonadota bacterium]
MPTLALPPGPKQRFPGQNLIAFRRDAIGFLRRLARDYGDIAFFQVSGPPTVLLNHPDHIRDVLVTNARCFAKGRGLERSKRLLGEGLLTSEGEFHLRQRRLMQPAFHRRRIETYGQVMADCAAQTRDRWQAGQTVDMSAEMTRLTLAIVGRTLFDADVEAEAAEIGSALTQAIHLFHVLMLPGAETLEKLPLPFVRRFRQARARLDAVIYRLIAEHRQGDADRGDLLSMLLFAQDEDKSRMTDEQVRDEAMTIFLAGHDTTANALTWTWYLLSQNPDAEARLHDELDAALTGRVPTVDDLPRLPYTRAVLAESMRLYPPAWIIGRRVLADYPVGEYVVPAGGIIILAQVVTQVDPRWFPDPLRFDPDRWTPDAEASRPKFAYFPFGGGPRTCIGEQFAWMEGILLLATLAARWRPRLVPGHPVVTEPIITLRPKHGMRMTLERR